MHTTAVLCMIQMKASGKQVFFIFFIYFLLSTLRLYNQKPKGVFLKVRTQNLRDISLFRYKEGCIGYLEPCSGPNLALFETAFLDF